MACLIYQRKHSVSKGPGLSEHPESQKAKKFEGSQTWFNYFLLQVSFQRMINGRRDINGKVLIKEAAVRVPSR